MTHSIDVAADAAGEALAADDALYRKISLRVVPFLFLCYVVSFPDRINIGFAQLQMKHDLGFSDAMDEAHVRSHHVVVGHCFGRHDVCEDAESRLAWRR